MNNLFDLTGKVALVTGASAGLGVQFAKALARQGADIAICARRVEKLEKVKAEIEELGVKCYAHKCDIVNVEEIKEMVKNIEEHFGKIDILVNNAGTVTDLPTVDMPDETWKQVISTNLDSVFYVAREVGKVMIKNNYGKIINIGSLHSEVAINADLWPLSAYCASKGGVKMLTKALAVEWAQHNITVNAIGPAYFDSEMSGEVVNSDDYKDIANAYIPMKRAGRPGELDGAIIYFASDASSYTTGQLLGIDGGWTAI